MQDRLEKERLDAKNAVEEYVYDMRDKLCGPFEEFCKEEVSFTNIWCQALNKERISCFKMLIRPLKAY